MKVISVTSGSKGGTGKSTIMVNTAVLHAYMATRRERLVMLLDAEPQAATSTLLLSRKIYNELRKGSIRSLTDFLTGNANFDDVFYVLKFKEPEQFYIAISSLVAPVDKLKQLKDKDINDLHSKLSEFIDELTKNLDLEAIYIDLPATSVFSSLSLAVYAVSDLIVPVGTPDPSCLISLYTTVMAIRDYIKPPPTIAPVVLNRISSSNAIEPITNLHYKVLYNRLINSGVFELREDENLSIARSAGLIEVLSRSLKYNSTVRALLKYAHKIATYPVEHTMRTISDHSKVSTMIGTNISEHAESILLALLRSRSRKPL